MRVAITGGTGFVGRNLAARLDDPVIVSRRTGVEIDDVDALAEAFAGCDAIAHCAGINREIGDQNYQRVHLDGTAAVIEAARRAGVKRIVMLSFLRARPNSGSAYHGTKFAAEEMIRASGLDFTILKSGMIYGPGDHMVDHVAKAVRTLPVFGTVGFRERTVRPVAVEDAVAVLVAALEGRVAEPAIAVMGAEELQLGTAVRRIARLAGGRALFVPLPLWAIRVVAVVTEALMVVPLVARAQAQMLGEGVSEPMPFAPEAAEGIRPAHGFDEERIRAALPQGGFTLNDLRFVRNLRKRAAKI